MALRDGDARAERVQVADGAVEAVRAVRIDDQPAQEDPLATVGPPIHGLRYRRKNLHGLSLHRHAQDHSHRDQYREKRILDEHRVGFILDEARDRFHRKLLDQIGRETWVGLASILMSEK